MEEDQPAENIQRKLRIMVVNDTTEILELFHQILEEEGYEVYLYSYSIEDLNEIRKVKPDLMIIDFLFGSDKTGWQLLQKLKMTRDLVSVPIIACTAATNFVREQEGYLASKDITVVLKPFDIDDLLNAVNKTVNRIQDPLLLNNEPKLEQDT